MIGISEIIGAASKVLDRVLPDPKAKSEALLELEKLRQSGELAVIAGQVEINKIEAASSDRWKSGWRPGVGWVCVVAMAVNFLVGPIGEWTAALLGNPMPFPKLDMGQLMGLLTGLLGLSGLRTVEKLKGATS